MSEWERAQEVGEGREGTTSDAAAELARALDAGFEERDRTAEPRDSLRLARDEIEQLDSGDLAADVRNELTRLRDVIERALSGDGDFVYPPEAPGVHGDPTADSELWHQQGDNSFGEDGTCAVVAQEMLIYKFTGEDPGEDRCVEVAIDNGWFQDGTAPADMGKVMGEFGIDTHQNYDCTVDDLAREIDLGRGVIVAVDADVLWYDEPVAGGANHAICVTGYERAADGSIVEVWVNDSGSPDGQAHQYSREQFELAFEGSGGFMLATDEAAPPRDSAMGTVTT